MTPTNRSFQQRRQDLAKRLFRLAGVQPNRSEAQWAQWLKKELATMKPNDERITQAKTQKELEMWERLFRNEGMEVRKLKRGSVVAIKRDGDEARVFRVWAPQ